MSARIEYLHMGDLPDLEAAIARFTGLTERKLAVLGEVPKLGQDELLIYAGLSAPLRSAGFARVFTVGEALRVLRGALPQRMRAAHADAAEDIAASVAAEMMSGDVVLVAGADASFAALAGRLDKGETAHAL